MDYATFKAKWLGKRVDYDKIYGFQCVDLIKQYMQETAGIQAGAWGNAIDYWYNTKPEILTKFSKLSTKQARRGDIVVLTGINGNPYGHIGIADSDVSGTMVTILEQNGSTATGTGTGGDAIRTRAVTLTRVVGVLRPKAAKPASQMPGIGERVKLTKGVTRTTFKAGTTTVAGQIKVTGDDFIYVVRGYDPVYANRILINSASAGGNGVALALFYTNGTKIEGWGKL